MAAILFGIFCSFICQVVPEAVTSELSVEVPENYAGNFPLYLKKLKLPPVHSDSPAVIQVAGEGVKEGLFGVESDSGFLFVTRPLDREEQAQYSLQVTITAEDGSLLWGPQPLVVHVKDVNDQVPQFTKADYAGTLSQGTHAGIPFLYLSATDGDEPGTANSDLRYHILSQTPSQPSQDMFLLEVRTGALTLSEKGSSELDPTIVSHYQLLVQVKDLGDQTSGHQTMATVNIAVVENTWLPPDSIHLAENAQDLCPSSFTHVHWSGGDVQYHLESQPPGPFEVNEEGNICVTQELDREIQDKVKRLGLLGVRIYVHWSQRIWDQIPAFLIMPSMFLSKLQLLCGSVSPSIKLELNYMTSKVSSSSKNDPNGPPSSRYDAMTKTHCTTRETKAKRSYMIFVRGHPFLRGEKFSWKSFLPFPHPPHSLLSPSLFHATSLLPCQCVYRFSMMNDSKRWLSIEEHSGEVRIASKLGTGQPKETYTVQVVAEIIDHPSLTTTAALVLHIEGDLPSPAQKSPSLPAPVSSRLQILCTPQNVPQGVVISGLQQEGEHAAHDDPYSFTLGEDPTVQREWRLRALNGTHAYLTMALSWLEPQEYFVPVFLTHSSQTQQLQIRVVVCLCNSERRCLLKVDRMKGMPTLLSAVGIMVGTLVAIGFFLILIFSHLALARKNVEQPPDSIPLKASV
ncbi:cadherin-16 [Gracilinanus agilis]|uniref:cadherin-16 n=1 Tax=Gracilinanus agilis TaxID=191870 RepID=UPI001CFD73B7|nr:cadherin-16 [Gracilinanus agilis]